MKKKQIEWIGKILIGQFAIAFPVFMFLVGAASNSEHARWNGEYEATTLEKLLEAIEIFLMAPAFGLNKIFPSLLPANLPVIFALNAVLTGLILIVVCLLFNQWQTRPQKY